MFKDLKVGVRLGIGFGFILMLLTAVTLFGINRMDSLSGLTGKMYRHPLTVSNAVLRINTNIIKIHRTMKDVVLVKDLSLIDEYSRIVNEIEKEVYTDFHIVSKRFLGGKELYEEARKLFIKWKPIRDEVILLMHSGKKDEAAAITRGKGADHVAKLENAMNTLTDFAQNKATGFLNDAEATKEQALNLMYLLVIISFVIAAVFAVFLTRSIIKPIATLRNATIEIGKGKLDTEIKIDLKDEIGQLASSFKKMTEDLQETTISRDKLEIVIRNRTSELSHLNEQLEELNKNLETRVKEEIENRLQKEQLLIQQSRMAAMGEMIGAIAHQWRQPLNAISVLLFAIKDAHAFGELNNKFINNALKQARIQLDFMSKTIDDFRNFFRPSKKMTRFDVKKAIVEVLVMCYPQLKSNNISCTLSCQIHKKVFDDFSKEIDLCGETTTMGYPNELKQAILNIVYNAKDTITLQKEKYLQASDNGKIDIQIDKEGDYIVTRINDNGGGIPRKIINRIFDPYFTTKKESKGTGIGLYMSKIIIEDNMNGKLYAENAGGGAQFTIKLKEQ